jgi:hypothetical protein
MRSEHSIQNEILRVFGSRSDMRIWRSNCGVATMGFGPDARKIRFGIPGQADVSGIILPTGQRMEIEVKKHDGRQSKDQKAFQQMIERFGGIYILARSVEDVHQALEQQINGYQR